MTTSSGFSVNTTVGIGIDLYSTGGISFTDANQSAITGFGAGIAATNYGTGALAITATGAVTGTSGDGIYAAGYGTDLTISGTGTVDVANADTITSVDISGGTLHGAGTLTVTGTLGQSDGEIAGTVNVAGAKTLDGGTISGTLGGAGAPGLPTQARRAVTLTKFLRALASVTVLAR